MLKELSAPVCFSVTLAGLEFFPSPTPRSARGYYLAAPSELEEEGSQLFDFPNVHSSRRCSDACEESGRSKIFDFQNVLSDRIRLSASDKFPAAFPASSSHRQ